MNPSFFPSVIAALLFINPKMPMGAPNKGIPVNKTAIILRTIPDFKLSLKKLLIYHYNIISKLCYSHLFYY